MLWSFAAMATAAFLLMPGPEKNTPPTFGAREASERSLKYYHLPEALLRRHAVTYINEKGLDPASEFLVSLEMPGVVDAKSMAEAIAYLQRMESYDLIQNDMLRDRLKYKARAEYGVNIIVDTLIDVAADYAEKNGRFESECRARRFCDKHVFKAALLTLKNMIMFDLQGQLVDQFVLVVESWEETMGAFDALPDWAALTPEHQDQFRATYCYRQLVDWRRWGVFKDWKKYCAGHVSKQFATTHFDGNGSSSLNPQKSCSQCGAHDCDRLAVHPLDREAGLSGVAMEDIDVPSARAACERAVREHPKVGRYAFNYARVALAAGDTGSASRLMQQAASSNYILAQTYLGYALLGQDAPFSQVEGLLHLRQNNEGAVRMFMKAALQGDLYGQAMLGWLYATGRGLKKSEAMARMWWGRAAANRDDRYENVRLYAEERLAELNASARGRR